MSNGQIGGFAKRRMPLFHLALIVDPGRSNLSEGEVFGRNVHGPAIFTAARENLTDIALFSSMSPQHCIALHCISFHCISLNCSALYCIALHCIELNCVELH